VIREWWRARRAAKQQDRVEADAQRDVRKEAVKQLRADLAAANARNERLSAQVAQLQSALAAVHIQGWMHGQIVQRDRAALVERAEAARQARLAGHPTSVYATQKIRRAE
jgi:uncharacterized protein YlxW (UPF0749 family)